MIKKEIFKKEVKKVVVTEDEIKSNLKIFKRMFDKERLHYPSQ